MKYLNTFRIIRIDIINIFLEKYILNSYKSISCKTYNVMKKIIRNVCSFAGKYTLVYKIINAT